jgi:hypothetical protein
VPFSRFFYNAGVVTHDRGIGSMEEFATQQVAKCVITNRKYFFLFWKNQRRSCKQGCRMFRFQSKSPSLGKFLKADVNFKISFMTIWHTLWPFTLFNGIFYILWTYAILPPIWKPWSAAVGLAPGVRERFSLGSSAFSCTQNQGDQMSW